MTGLRPMLRDDAGASAAEFALVLPLLLLFLFGIIDAGRFMWEYNQAEKATQMGVRYAVATDPVLAGLDTYSFAVDGGIVAGQPIPTASFSEAECTSATCSCTGAACSSLGHDPDAFANIRRRMTAMYSPIGDENVIIEYRNVGLGYAGDPNGPDVAPLVTVRLTDLNFQPLTTMIFGTDMEMPDFRAALTLEDGSGSVAN